MRGLLLAVNGTLMRGLELNPNLLRAGAGFVRETVTEPAYRLWSIEDRHPAMIRVKAGGVAVAVEILVCPSRGPAGHPFARAAGSGDWQGQARRRGGGPGSSRRAGPLRGSARDHRLRGVACLSARHGPSRNPLAGGIVPDALASSRIGQVPLEPGAISRAAAPFRWRRARSRIQLVSRGGDSLSPPRPAAPSDRGSRQPRAGPGRWGVQLTTRAR